MHKSLSRIGKIRETWLQPKKSSLLQINHLRLCMLASVTRFGEISPNWQYTASLWAIFKSLNQYLAKFYTIFGKLLCFCANFHCYKCPNIEKSSSHLVTLHANQVLAQEKVLFKSQPNWEVDSLDKIHLPFRHAFQC